MAASVHLPPDVETLSAEEILGFCLREFAGKVALACSFQKEEAVLLDMVFAIEPRARVFAIDTHYLFPETYELWREVERRYDTKVEVFEGPSPEELAATHGEQLWERKPDLYLAIAKVEPLVRDRGLPYNPLHNRGYESIGDTHSTVPGAGREGRWAGTGRTECGLHVPGEGVT